MVLALIFVGDAFACRRTGRVVVCDGLIDAVSDDTRGLKLYTVHTILRTGDVTALAVGFARFGARAGPSFSVLIDTSLTGDAVRVVAAIGRRFPCDALSCGALLSLCAITGACTGDCAVLFCLGEGVLFGPTVCCLLSICGDGLCWRGLATLASAEKAEQYGDQDDAYFGDEGCPPYLLLHCLYLTLFSMVGYCLGL